MYKVNFYSGADSKAIMLAMDELAAPSKELKPLEANTVDAKVEKHVPVCSVIDGQLAVNVGSEEHPMLPEHYIEWIFVQMETGGMYRMLSPGDKPMAIFPVQFSEVVGVYAYCNLHGLWKANIDSTPDVHETVCSADFNQGCIDS